MQRRRTSQSTSTTHSTAYSSSCSSAQPYQNQARLLPEPDPGRLTDSQIDDLFSNVGLATFLTGDDLPTGSPHGAFLPDLELDDQLLLPNHNVDTSRSRSTRPWPEVRCWEGSERATTSGPGLVSRDTASSCTGSHSSLPSGSPPTHLGGHFQGSTNFRTSFSNVVGTPEQDFAAARGRNQPVCAYSQTSHALIDARWRDILQYQDELYEYGEGLLAQYEYLQTQGRAASNFSPPPQPPQYFGWHLASPTGSHATTDGRSQSRTTITASMGGDATPRQQLQTPMAQQQYATAQQQDRLRVHQPALAPLRQQPTPRIAMPMQPSTQLSRLPRPPSTARAFISCPHADCHETFTRRKSLERHLDTVHGKVRYRCLVCSSLNCREDRMWDHCRKKHGQMEGRERYDEVTVE